MPLNETICLVDMQALGLYCASSFSSSEVLSGSSRSDILKLVVLFLYFILLIQFYFTSFTLRQLPGHHVTQTLIADWLRARAVQRRDLCCATYCATQVAQQIAPVEFGRKRKPNSPTCSRVDLRLGLQAQ